jgi:molecular chaperone DnaJ
MKEDLYQILGLSRDASDVDIKRAYRRLAHEYHPDKHQGDKEAEEHFKKINAAYEILKNPEKKNAYDRFGHLGERAYGGSGDFGFTADFQDIFGDIFGDFFGGRTTQRGQRGADLKYDLTITFEESAFGTEKELKIPKTVACEECDGSGARAGTVPVRCETCAGRGQVRYQQGLFSISRPCPNCNGSGQMIKDPCKNCYGSGRTKKTHTIQVKIPAGVSRGARLKLTGEGEHGMQGGPPGNLYVLINVKNHTFFERENDDILCEVPISMPQAALGCEIAVPTLEGKAKVKVPAGTQSGKILSLRGKGFPSLHGYGKGDQHIIVKVETPTKLSKKQKELLIQFENISQNANHPLVEGFIDKVKGLFGGDS